jgi:hypothetical protein
MSDNANSRWGGKPRNSFVALAIIILVLVGAGAVYAMTMKRDRGHAPKLLNQPTEARIVKPFTAEPDKRFAPLPIEREKHGK